MKVLMHGIFLIVISFMIVVYLIPNVSALGIASDFLINNTIELQKGESRLYGVRLQNPSLDVKRVIFGLQGDIANVVDYKEVYEFSEEQTIIPIVINVTAPKNAFKGQEFTVGYYVEPIEVPGGGLPIKSRIDKGFRVVIKEQPSLLSFAYSYSYIHIIIAIYILLAILVIFFLLHKPKKKIKTKYRRKRK